MSLRARTLWLTALSIAALVAVIYLSAARAFMAGFSDAERYQIKRHAIEVQRLIDQRVANLDTICHDWASWDDTYAFAQDNNQTFRNSNLVPSAVVSTNVHLIVILDPGGGTRWQQWYDLKHVRKAPLPAGLERVFAPGSLLRTEPAQGRAISGIVDASCGPLMVVARPILDSDGHGPSHGTLIFGRLLAGKELQLIRDASQLEVDLHSQTSGGGSQGVEQVRSRLVGPGPLFSRPEGENVIAGYTILPEVTGQPGLLLRVAGPRDVFRLGQRSVSYLVAPVILFGAVLGLALLLLLEHSVLSRIAKLSSDVAAVGVSGDSSQRVSLPGRDELSGLANRINDTFAALARSGARLQERDELNRAITENVPAGLIILDRQLRVLAANPQAHKWFPALGQSAGHPCHRSVMSPERAEPCEFCPASLTFADGLVHEVDCEWPGPDGTMRSYRLLSSPIRDASGQVNRVLQLVADETYHRRLEEQLRQAAKMEAVGRLAGGIAHDFNNLLTGMRGIAQLVQMGRCDANKLVGAVLTSTQAGAEITRNLLAFARPQAPQRRLAYIETALDAALEVAVRQLENAEVEVVRQYQDERRPAEHDPVQLQQVMLNLVINATHAMPHGGTLTVSTAYPRFGSDPAEVVITVADTGGGIAPQNLSHVFDPFFTTKGHSGNNEISGTGLGLSASHGIIAAHGGTMTVNSVLGAGATFEIRLPLPSTSDAKPAQAVAALPTAVAPPQLAGVQALIAEDDESVAAMLRDVLALTGCGITQTATATRAIEALKAQEYDLVISDLMMPGGGGRAVLEFTSSLAHPPAVIIVTGRLEKALHEESAGLGPSATIEKPFDVQQLLGTICEVLKSRHD